MQIMRFAAQTMCAVTLLLISSTAKAAWEFTTYANEQRSEAGTVLHDGKILVFNGVSTNRDIVNSVEVFDPRTGSWIVAASTERGLGNASMHSGIVLIDDEVWLIGGQFDDGPGSISNKVWIYNIASGEWRQGPELPVPVAAGGAALVNNKIHVFGGYDYVTGCATNHHFSYDTGVNNGWQDITASAKLPQALSRFSTVAFNERIYVFGGEYAERNCSSGSAIAVDTAYQYNPQKNSWRKLASLPLARSRAESGSFEYGGKIFMTGGEDLGTEILAFSPSANAWKVEQWLSLPDEIEGVSARIIDDRFFVALGQAGNDKATSLTRSVPYRDSSKPSIVDSTLQDAIPTPTTTTRWSDSYSVDGQCYCDSTFDHDIGKVLYQTPVGEKEVKTICLDIENKFGTGDEQGRAYYNTIQCGYTPLNSDRISDEWYCPGIARAHKDYTGYRCFENGASWNLDAVYSTEPVNPVTPGDIVPVETNPEEPDLLPDENTPDSEAIDVNADEVDFANDASETETTPSGELLETIVYRINAGGPLLKASDGDWQSDSSASVYVNTGKVWSQDSKIDTAFVPQYVPAELFQTERWDKSQGPEMQWDLPVTPGRYEVRLYFAELWEKGMKPGKRVFDVTVEDQMLNDLDIYVEAGGDTGLMKSFIVDSDDVLNIGLQRKTRNPNIKGIEVILLQESDLTAGADPSIAPAEEIEIPAVAVDVEEMSDATTVPTGSSPNEVDHVVNAGSPAVLDSDENDEPKTETTPSGELSETIVYRINAGGPLLKASDGDWQSDSSASVYVNTGKVWSQDSKIDTAFVPQYVPAELFQTERWDKSQGPEMQWDLPVTPGRYEVRLYFAELWEKGMKPGKRVFDVTVEDQMLNDLDIYVEAGGDTGLMKSFIVDSDDVLNIGLQRKTRNPNIKGIEVILLQESDLTAGADPSIAPAEEIEIPAVAVDVEEMSDATIVPTDSSPANRSGDVVYRINAGGPAIKDPDGDWLADNKGSPFVNTGKTWSQNRPVDTSHVPSHVPASLFQTERWDKANGPDLQWKLPVEPGSYEVRLYFSELWTGAMKKGVRVFDVAVEGQTVKDLDVFVEAGGDTGLMKVFYVTSDNSLDIQLMHVKQNPAIKGIEVLAVDVP